MHRKPLDDWQKMRRFVVGLFVAYAILIQALASPFLRAQSAELARLEGPLSLLCLSEGVPGHGEPGQRKMPHGHGLECCLPSLRFAWLDAPVLISSILIFVPPVAPPSYAADYNVPPTRAPPDALATILQPRAPPVSIV